MRVALLVVLLVLLLSLVAFRNRLFSGGGRQDRNPLFAMIDAFRRQWPVSLDTVSRISGARLRKSEDDGYFATYKSSGGLKAPLREVELRLPSSARARSEGILILSIDAELRITPEAVRKQFGSQPELRAPDPAAPYEVYYGYEQPWGKLSFAFARGSEYLLTVSLEGARLAAAGEKWLDTFAAYPGARELCSQHVSGNLAHILWTAYATYDLPEPVIAFYTQAEGKEKAEQSGNSVDFRHGDKSLSIHRASAKDYPDCGRPPRSKEKTVLIVSQAIRSH